MTPRERAIDLRKNLARIGILLDEERAINMIEQAFVIAITDQTTGTDIHTHADGNTKELDEALQEIYTSVALVISSDRLVHLTDQHQRELRSIPSRVHDAGCAARALVAERDAERQRADTAERELEYAHIHGRNVEIERDEARRRVKELETALREIDAATREATGGVVLILGNIARAAGYAEAKEAAALKCDEFSRDAASCAAREEADCDIAEADIHSHAANCGRTLARSIRALAPAATTEKP